MFSAGVQLIFTGGQKFFNRTSLSEILSARWSIQVGEIVLAAGQFPHCPALNKIPGYWVPLVYYLPYSLPEDARLQLEWKATLPHQGTQSSYVGIAVLQSVLCHDEWVSLVHGEKLVKPTKTRKYVSHRIGLLQCD